MKKQGRVTTDHYATKKTWGTSANKFAKSAGNDGNTKSTTLPGDGCPAARKGKAKAPGAY